MKKIFLIGLLLFSGVVNSAIVSLTPKVQAVSDGDAVFLDLSGSEFITGITGGSFSLSFDSSVLNFVGATFNDVTFEFSNQMGTIDNTAGTVTDGIFSSFVGTTDTIFDIAIFEFLAVGSGLTNVILMQGQGAYADASFSDITSSVLYESATVEVSAVPLPAAAWLFLSGLGLIGFTARKKK